MGTKMLIDASQPEETRVVVARGNRLEEFDFESASKTPLKGNIYLAKVTRVEPSLQAAFVEYGGNRHGFLAFAEIHPDYYQIPIADRMALLAEQEAEEAAENEDDEEEEEAPASEAQVSSDENGEPVEEDHHHDDEPHGGAPALALDQEPEPVLVSDVEEEHHEHEEAPTAQAEGAELVEVDGDADSQKVETLGDEADALEEVPQRSRRAPRKRHYKIQEVIKRRQILLVQVVKEERGDRKSVV